jgi:hypothetical protein
VYLITFVSWFRYRGRTRDRIAILISNAFILVFYTVCCALQGDKPCGADQWFCTEWYEDVMFIGMIHLALFWLFMIAHMLLEFLVSVFQTPKQ